MVLILIATEWQNLTVQFIRSAAQSHFTVRPTCGGMTAVGSSGIVGAVLGQSPILASHGIPGNDGRRGVPPVILVSGTRDGVVSRLRRRRCCRSRRERRRRGRGRQRRGPAYGHRVVPVPVWSKQATFLKHDLVPFERRDFL